MAEEKSDRVEVPKDAPAVLQFAQQKTVQLRTELLAFRDLTAGYLRYLKLDPTRNYQFLTDGEKTFAEEVDQSALQPLNPPEPEPKE